MENDNCLQTLMKNRNLSYEKLAKMTGISSSTLQRIATFEQSPTQKVMIAIARGLRMDVVEVFNLDWRK